MINEKLLHKLSAVALIVSIKNFQDFKVKYSFLAEVCGIDNEDLMELEMMFMQLIDWETFVSCELFETYSSSLMEVE